MSEQDIVEMMYRKHHKLILNAQEAAIEWGSSYSSLSKIFGGADALPESTILEKKIIPEWIEVGGRRMWKITDIAYWLVNTEGGKIDG